MKDFNQKYNIRGEDETGRSFNIEIVSENYTSMFQKANQDNITITEVSNKGYTNEPLTKKIKEVINQNVKTKSMQRM